MSMTIVTMNQRQTGKRVRFLLIGDALASVERPNLKGRMIIRYQSTPSIKKSNGNPNQNSHPILCKLISPPTCLQHLDPDPEAF